MADATIHPAKRALRDELLRSLERDLEQLEVAHRAATEAATHDEAKPENSKDTRALEQSYLARGQAKRVEELRRAVAEVAALPLRALGEAERVRLGALVSVDEEGDARALFVAPHGGGSALDGGRVQVVTPTSPLGRALVGLRAGDVCEVATGGRTRELAVMGVA